LRKKKNIRYKNSREKPLNQEIQPFPSENQTGYKKEYVQNQGILIKDNMPTEVKTSSSKKTFINHPYREDKYKDLNKGSDSYEIPGKGNINYDKSFLEPKKDKKVRQKQIGSFHQKEKETYESLNYYTGTFTIDDYSFLENGTGVAVHWKSENPEEDALVRKYATLPATSENPTHVTRGARNPNYIVRENIKLPSGPNYLDKKNEGNYYTLSIYHVKNQ